LASDSEVVAGASEGICSICVFKAKKCADVGTIAYPYVIEVVVASDEDEEEVEA